MMVLASWLHALYVFTAIFGGGVTIVDMLGMLGAEDSAGDDADGGESAAGAETHGSILSIVRYLRICVYFCLGFGPLGLVAEATGSSALGSLLWALPGGVLAAVLARAFFRWQHHDIDSSVTDEDLLLQRGRVIVPLSHQRMGRIRLRMGPVVVERYALAADEVDEFRAGDVVEVIRVTDACVYVHRAEDGLLEDTR